MIRFLLCLITPIPDGKDLSEKQIQCLLRKRGYRESDHQFVMDLGSRSNTVTLTEDGIKIRARVPGYGESDFIKYPVTKAQLKSFLSENEV